MKEAGGSHSECHLEESKGAFVGLQGKPAGREWSEEGMLKEIRGRKPGVPWWSSG